MTREPPPILALRTVLTGTVAAALFAMMALTVVDVLARKLLHVVVPGSVELTELLMLAVVFAGLPLASLAGEHVFFDLLDHLLPASARRVQALLSHAFCAALLLGAAWLVYQRAGRTAEFGDETAQLGIELARFHYAIAVLLAVTGVVHLALMRRRDAPAADASEAPAQRTT